MPYNTVIDFVAFDQLSAADLNSNFDNLDFLLTRVSPRITTVSSSATPSIDIDIYDTLTITALATNITSVTVTGTPNDFQKMIVRIKDNGVARSITWGSSFEAVGAALPTTTVVSKRLVVGFIYDSVSAKWGCVAVNQEV